MKPIKALDTHCTIICGSCSKVIVSKVVRSEIPRAEMRQAATDSGAMFVGHQTFCNDECLRQFHNQSTVRVG